MPVTPAPAAPPYPPLRQVFPLASLGQQLAMVFLILMALAGFAGMSLIWSTEVYFVLQEPWLINQKFSSEQLLCVVLDTLVFGHCLYQIRHRGRSRVLPGIIFTLILASLTSFGTTLAQGDFSRDRATYIQMIAIHSGPQILAAGALLALRRVRWIGWLPQ
jgi:uncharacterized BrkB/YihY/UPF0761 family membrane protein